MQNLLKINLVPKYFTFAIEKPVKPVKICFAFLTKAFHFRNAFILL